MKKNSVKINILIILLTGLFSLAPTCQSGITQSTTYPIELFSEMHYSQAYKSQETPRLKPVAEAVVNLDPIGTENQYDMTIEKFKYDYESGENLYRVNCSFCHGNEGLGDGPAKEYIISENSYYSTNKVEGLPGSGSGTPYISPPQLNDIEERYGNRDSAYNRIYQMLNSEIGFGPMPGFLRVLSEEERKQIIEFILDKDNGLNK